MIRVLFFWLRQLPGLGFLFAVLTPTAFAQFSPVPGSNPPLIGDLETANGQEETELRLPFVLESQIFQDFPPLGSESPDFPVLSQEAPSPINPPPSRQEAVLRLDAHLSPQSRPLRHGLVWRIFSAEIGLDNKLPLLDSQQGGHVEFVLPAGDYFVHVAFGQAETSRRFTLEEGHTYYENLELGAGGLILAASAPDGKINKNRVRFSIYKQADELSGQTLIVEDVKPDHAVRLKAGGYHIISAYGDANAIASADIQIEAGKLTEAIVEHHAAQVTLKLVREAGGQALADTSWVIMTASGDTVREVGNAYVDIVLTEGDYTAYARNKDQSYQQEFSVSPGEDIEVDLLMSRDKVADVVD